MALNSRDDILCSLFSLCEILLFYIVFISMKKLDVDGQHGQQVSIHELIVPLLWSLLVAVVFALLPLLLSLHFRSQFLVFSSLFSLVSDGQEDGLSQVAYRQQFLQWP